MPAWASAAEVWRRALQALTPAVDDKRIDYKDYKRLEESVKLLTKIMQSIPKTRQTDGILHGDLQGTIDQLVLAKQSGNDYYQLSTIETELKQYREIAAAYSKTGVVATCGASCDRKAWIGVGSI